MIPLIDRNAKLRKPGVDEALVQQRALALLSDDKCTEIIRLAREVRKQMQGGQNKRARGDSDEPPDPPAKLARVELAESVAAGAVTVEENRMASKKPSLPVPGAADDTDMAVDSESHDSGVSQDPSTAETSALPPEPHALQSPPSPRAGTPANTDTDPSTDPHADTLATDINTDVTVDVGLPSAVPSDLPPAMRTARSRPPEHAPGPAGRASLSSTTSTTPPDSETRLISGISPPRTPPPVLSQVETQPGSAVLSTSTTDTSRHEDVTPHINATPEHEEVAQPSEHLDDDVSMDLTNQDSSPLQDPPRAPALVPGLWAAVAGRLSPGIEKIEFFVDDATADAARCWAQRQESFRSVSPRLFSVCPLVSRTEVNRSLDDRHVAVHLLCLPQASVTSVVENLGIEATPADIVAALWKLKPSWPTQGSLVVQAGPLSQKDPSHDIRRAWLPLDLVRRLFL